MSEFPTLEVTSPRMKNGHVAHAQHIMQGNNRWGVHFYRGELDGIYGRETGAATRRAKVYLGYPRRKWTTTFSHTIYGYLVEPNDPQHLKLPFMYKLRHNRRLKKAQNWHNGIIEYAAQFVGYKESPPGSNMNKFGAWYGANGVPWCAIFVTYCLHHVTHGPQWFRYSYVPNIVDDARRGVNGMYITHTPNPGAIVCYDWDDDGEADHTEIFEKWINKGTSFQTIGGNTGSTNASNGGEVMRPQRFVSDVQAFVGVP